MYLVKKSVQFKLLNKFKMLFGALAISFLVALNIIIVYIAEAKESVSCLDESGKAVDWFFVYKLPRHYGKPGDTCGKRHLYLTSLNSGEWKLSNLKINNTKSLVGQTLTSAMDNSDNYFLAYNDEIPSGKVVSTGGHAKGVIAANNETGFWLIHSVPKFPTLPTYSYPESGEQYGQSFLCITVPKRELDKIGYQLRYIQPNVYYQREPMELYNMFPELTKVQLRDWLKDAPYNNSVDIETVEGASFMSFAKSPKFGMDLYEDFVAPTLDVNLLVESWRNGPGNLASNCSLKEKVFNVNHIENEEYSISFKSTLDHSKWAVSPQSGFTFFKWTFGAKGDWICVGDINRQKHQLERGGGTVCYENKDIVKLYREIVGEYELCN